MTALDRPLRRAIRIGEDSYVVTLEPSGLRLVRKGHRKGIALTWEQILAGEVALAAQLAGSLSATANRRAEDPG
ncbi:MAG TPA: hypothetical protein VL049_09755 [Candidatus Dormibacteraeota bacterium]|nr:hypothetical protein [Candidatus Dormibacteraeota bacterium]